MKKNSYIRTKKGEELNENLEGLKNYLKDFSTMHEKDEKSLTLWEDYLIYSVILENFCKSKACSHSLTKLSKSIEILYILLNRINKLSAFKILSRLIFLKSNTPIGIKTISFSIRTLLSKYLLK